MENIAKSTSYGCYLDCDFETAKYPDDKTHIVGLLAEYVYDLEQRILHYDERYIKLWNEIETLRECVSKEFDQEQKISDLEAKLAESENNHELLIDQFEEETEKLRKQIKQESDARERFVVEVKSLKQKLAEKDEEIKQLNNRILFSQLQAPNEQILNILGSQCVQYNPNQDKISFAVEQLEQLKKLCQEKFNWWENSEWEGDIYDKSDVSNAYFDIEANIDNQIKAIKGEK